MQRLALYIHWPFCKKKCPYCDFNSHVREEVDHARYRRALLAELHHMHSLMPDAALSSIFFGGGTPSLMHPDTTAALIDAAKTLWPVHPSSVQAQRNNESLEITLEANPTSVEASRFAAFRDAGVNRLSLGIQSLRPESLAFLGREHSADEALSALDVAKTYFERYSFDLIYALPHQTPTAWQAELREALQHAGGHLSLYQLTIEPNTAFHTAYFGKKSFTLPDESSAAALYEHTQAIMEEAGLPAYEISNHARSGQASHHNLSYWRSDAYIGIGPGAHGRILKTNNPSGIENRPDRATAPAGHAETFATRTYKTPERWVEIVERDGHAIEEMTPITPEERMEEKLLMGLRLTEGLPLSRFTPEERAHLDARINMRSLSMLEQTGLLTRSPTHWHITAKGKLVLNSIIETLLT